MSFVCRDPCRPQPGTRKRSSISAGKPPMACTRASCAGANDTTASGRCRWKHEDCGAGRYWEAAHTADLLRRVQAVELAPSTAPGKQSANNTFLLSLRCGLCGEAMHG